MPNWKVTVEWNQSVMGVSETYYSDSILIDPLVNNLNKLLDARRKMLWADYHKFVGVRISNDNLRRSSIYFPPGTGWIVPGATKALAVPEEGQRSTIDTDRPDHLRSVVQYRVMYDGGQRQAIRYLSGVPDWLTATEPLTLNEVKPPSDWIDQYVKWRDLLIANWRVKARKNTVPNQDYDIAGFSVQGSAPSNLGLKLNTATRPGIDFGDKVHVHGVLFKNRGRATVNGIWRVDSVVWDDVNKVFTIYLRGSNGIDPSTIKTPGKVQLVGFTYYPIDAIQLLRAGEHKRGRPSHAPRGRRLTRTLLDG